MKNTKNNTENISEVWDNPFYDKGEEKLRKKNLKILEKSIKKREKKFKKEKFDDENPFK